MVRLSVDQIRFPITSAVDIINLVSTIQRNLLIKQTNFLSVCTLLSCVMVRVCGHVLPQFVP